MLATGIFLFLLGTKIERISAVQSDIEYEPSRITIREHIEQDPDLVPKLGPPPYYSNFIHQGSNYFFGMPLPISQEFLKQATPTEKIVPEIREQKTCENFGCKPEITEILVENENLPFTNPMMEVKTNELVQNPRLSLPIPNISLNIQPIPQLPPIPIVNTQIISKLPLPSLNIPGLPFLKSSKASKTPMLVERSVRTPDVISEVDMLVKKIPAPPELPPLVLEEVLKTVILEEKNIILVPSAPEIELILPSVFISGKRICPPTLCAQNIVLERVLPNLTFEKSSKTVELISIPASKRVPVVTRSLFSFLNIYSVGK